MILQGVLIDEFLPFENVSDTENYTKSWQMELQELKIFSKIKEIVSRMKRQPTEWEKILANFSSDKDWYLEFIKTSKVQHPENHSGLGRWLSG